LNFYRHLFLAGFGYQICFSNPNFGHWFNQFIVTKFKLHLFQCWFLLRFSQIFNVEEKSK